MKRLLLFAMIAACGGGGTGDDFPVKPGGPGGPNTPLDAPVIDAADRDALSTLAGRVCIAADLRAQTSGCATTGADGITVTLGTKTATTTADGSFAIDKPSGSNLVWRASRVDLVTSVVPFGTSNTLPAIGLEDYLDLQGANSVVVVSGRGSIMARVVKNGAAQASVTATVSPLADAGTHYAGNAELNWPETALGTSAFGMIWIPNAQLATTTVTATPSAGGIGSASSVVEDQAITYLTIDLP